LLIIFLSSYFFNIIIHFFLIFFADRDDTATSSFPKMAVENDGGMRAPMQQRPETTSEEPEPETAANAASDDADDMRAPHKTARYSRILAELSRVSPPQHAKRKIKPVEPFVHPSSHNKAMRKKLAR
jgi:hypothetical protein